MRLKIWKLSLPDYRLIRISPKPKSFWSMSEKIKCIDGLGLFQKLQQKNPVLLRVCSESRAVTLKEYCYYEKSFHGFQIRTFFNPKREMAYFSSAASFKLSQDSSWECPVLPLIQETCRGIAIAGTTLDIQTCRLLPVFPSLYGLAVEDQFQCWETQRADVERWLDNAYLGAPNHPLNFRLALILLPRKHLRYVPEFWAMR